MSSPAHTRTPVVPLGPRSERSVDRVGLASRRLRHTTATLVRLCLAGSLLAGCGEELDPLTIARCHADAECSGEKVCELGACVPKDTVSCQAVEGGQAILQPGPPLVEFGQVGEATSFRELVLRNIGNCTLTIFEASLEAGATSPFACPACTPEAFPLELFPFREKRLEVAFTPGGVGDFRDVLVLLSDDAEFPQIQVPVRARYRGQPVPAAVPSALEFGFVPVGRTVTKTVEISNRGSGDAELKVTAAEVRPTSSTAFSYEPELTAEVELLPVRQHHDSVLRLRVNYHPRDVGRHQGELVVTTRALPNGVIRVPLSGTSETPPKIAVSPESLQFGVVPLGTTNAIPLTITNEGGSPLEVRYRWGGQGLSTDLSALPQLVPGVRPGQYTELTVFVTATAPAPITGLLILETNDPARPTVTIPVSATGQDVVGMQAVKIEMSFDNSDNSFFDSDFRNVDLALESPFGLICNKQVPSPGNWGAHGTPSWIALGATEEPERVVLFGAQQDGVYRVLLNYQEDCAALPSSILSAILGVGIDVIIGVTLGGVIPGLDGSRISDVIDDICFDHEPSTATLTVSVNGQVIKEVSSRLEHKGDYRYALELVRANGQFAVR